MNIPGFIIALAFTGLILVFISGYTGWLLVYTLIGAVLISAQACMKSRDSFDVNVEEFSGVAASGDYCTIKINLRKNGLCFSPCIKVYGEFCGQKFAAQTALLFKSSASVEVKIRTNGCGLRKAKIDNAVVHDFVGIARLKRKLNVSTSVAVMPQRVDYIGPAVTPSLLPSEDEDREEGQTVAFGGTAGYEHRPYADGDSPRRINYKLSAKKQQLMVRLDESVGSEAVRIVLMPDCGGGSVEQAFALAEKMLLRNSPVTVYHLNESFSATQPSSGEQLREWLAFRDLDEAGDTKIPEGAVVVTFTSDGITVR